MSGEVDRTHTSIDGAAQPTAGTTSTSTVATTGTTSRSATTIHTAAQDAVAASRKERP